MYWGLLSKCPNWHTTTQIKIDENCSSVRPALKPQTLRQHIFMNIIDVPSVGVSFLYIVCYVSRDDVCQKLNKSAFVLSFWEPWMLSTIILRTLHFLYNHFEDPEFYLQSIWGPELCFKSFCGPWILFTIILRTLNCVYDHFEDPEFCLQLFLGPWILFTINLRTLIFCTIS